MLKHKKSKVKRMRGTSSHGWGHKKKHRGAGHRGGVGNAGTGARGDSKKPSILVKHGKKYYGKKGFTSVHRRNVKTLSLCFIENHFDELVESKVIVNGVFDTTLLKVDKVLGRGKLSHKVELVVREISANAKAAVEEAGGKVSVVGGEEEVAAE